MIKKILTLSICVLLFLVTNLITAREKTYEKNQLLVQISDKKMIAGIIAPYQIINGISTELEVKKQVSFNNRIWLLNFNEEKINIDEIINILKHDEHIQIVQKNHWVEFRDTIPDDPNFQQQWQYKNNGGSGAIAGADMHANPAWDYSTGGITATNDTIVIAIVDDGINLNHPDFNDNIWTNFHEIPNNGTDDDGNGFTDDIRGWNFSNNSNNVSGGWHGTQVAGCAGAKGNNTTGVSGVNWNIKLMIILYGSIGSVSNPNEANVIASYDYALTMRKMYNESNGLLGAFVVATNSSWGIDEGQPADAPLWCAFYDTLGHYGILSAGATANQNWDIDVKGDLPTACPSDYLIAVTNTTKSDTRNSGAGYGLTTIDLGAPGTDVYTTQQGTFGGFYGTATGTSFATPHVAGTAGLLYSVPCPEFMYVAKNFPDSAALLVKQFILQGTDTIMALQGKTLTGGRLNLNESILRFNEFCQTIDTTGNSLKISAIKKEDKIFFVNPNPSSGKVNINYSDFFSSGTMTVFNILGEIVYHVSLSKLNSTGKISHPSNSIDLSNHPKGMYFITLKTRDEIIETEKLILLE